MGIKVYVLVYAKTSLSLSLNRDYSQHILEDYPIKLYLNMGLGQFPIPIFFKYKRI